MAPLTTGIAGALLVTSTLHSSANTRNAILYSYTAPTPSVDGIMTHTVTALSMKADPSQSGYDVSSQYDPHVGIDSVASLTTNTVNPEYKSTTLVTCSASSVPDEQSTSDRYTGAQMAGALMGGVLGTSIVASCIMAAGLKRFPAANRARSTQDGSSAGETWESLVKENVGASSPERTARIREWIKVHHPDLRPSETSAVDSLAADPPPYAPSSENISSSVHRDSGKGPSAAGGSVEGSRRPDTQSTTIGTEVIEMPELARRRPHDE